MMAMEDKLRCAVRGAALAMDVAHGGTGTAHVWARCGVGSTGIWSWGTCVYEAAQSCRAKIEQLVGNEEKEKKEYDKVIFLKNLTWVWKVMHI